MKIDSLSMTNKLRYRISNRINLLKEKVVLTVLPNSKIADYRLHSILKYANAHCNYYRRTANSVDNILEWPVISKEILKNNFNDFVSDENEKLIYKDAYTGGSTGEPFHFYNQMIYDGLYQNKLWKRMGYKKGDIILAMDGTKVDDNLVKKGVISGIKSKKQLPYGGYFLSSLYLRDDNIEEYVRYIFDLKPAFIRGYPFFIYTIAKYIQDKGYRVDFNIKAIELTSESSFPYQRTCIQDAFHTQVFMQYGHTECCAFAYTYNDTYQYRIESLYGLIEVLGKDNNPVNEGEIGEIVVTTLYNKIFPLIRYKTGDYAEVGFLDNGEMILTNIFGRTQDYILDYKGNKIMITALIMAQHFNAMGHIVKWQIEQSEKGIVTMHIIKGKDYSTSDERELEELFYNNGEIKIVFDYVQVLPVTKRGKSKLIIQNVESD